MRITDLDRRRAIKRFPEFQKEYARYLKLKLGGSKANEFEVDFAVKWHYELWQIIYADETAQHRKDSQSIAVIDYAPLSEEIENTMLRIVYKGDDCTKGNIFGKYLYLKISKANLDNRTEKQLIKDFRDTIAPYRKLLGKQRSRGTDEEKGVWPIYDLYMSKGKNMLKTTQQLFKVKGNPGIYGFDEKYYKRSIKAISNAENIINTVRKEYNLKPSKILKRTP